jgi:hypothetical protein
MALRHGDRQLGPRVMAYAFTKASMPSPCSAKAKSSKPDAVLESEFAQAIRLWWMKAAF